MWHNGFKLQEDKFQFNFRKSFPIIRVVETNRLDPSKSSSAVNMSSINAGSPQIATICLLTKVTMALQKGDL